MARRGRILLLGGLAVIAHGLSRATRDADIWMEPFENHELWTSHLSSVAVEFRGLRLRDLRHHKDISSTDAPAVIKRDGVIRIVGADRPLDVFRHPNNLDISDFDVIWGRAIAIQGNIRLPDDIDLLATKENTSRAQDMADISFLETKIRDRLKRELVECDPDRAAEIFQRYVDHETCRAALDNPHTAVRDAARSVLMELAADGDPFAKEILRSS